jgi:hypothetical protein
MHYNRPNDFGPDGLSRVPTRGEAESARGSSGPYAAYCVRLCDGRYFPIHGRDRASTAARCSSFCPATTTKIFSGSGIDHAVSGDGQRYADLPNAFVYRQKLVAGCTCNGKNPAGVVHAPVVEDPTLRPGDIVATNSGLTVFQGRNPDQQAVLTPIDSANVPKSLRSHLADVKVTPRPRPPHAVPAAPAQEPTSASPGDRRRFSARAPGT